MNTSTILIVEDEAKLASLLQDYLHQSNYRTHIIDDGDDVLPWFTSNTCDLVLLDIMLPNKDGLEICKELRQVSEVPIIMCTARVEEIDRLLGLELGADDYVCKPYSPREVVARVKTILRRVQRLKSGNSNYSLVSPIQLDERTYKARIIEDELTLTAIEFQLLAMMTREPGRIFSREQLMNHAYKDHRVVSDRTIDSHIKKLRSKIKTATEGKDFIHSVYGVGYKFEDSNH